MAGRTNPFTPDKPISPDFFAGRFDEVSKVLSAIGRTRAGNAAHVLITGDRGIGKSSLAWLARYLAQTGDEGNRPFLTAYVLVQDATTLQHMCELCLRDLGQNVRKSALQEVWDFLKVHMKLTLFGTAEISLEPQRISDLVSEFAYVLEEVSDRASKDTDGMLIIIDEFDRIAGKQKGLASFFKSLFEKLTVDGYGHIMFMIVGLSDIRHELAEDHPSIMRCFLPIELPVMHPTEIEEFVRNALAPSGVACSPEVMSAITYYSGGYPVLVHELGYALFETDSDGSWDWTDFLPALKRAVRSLEQRLFAKMYTVDIKSKLYRDILNILATAEGDEVSLSEIKKRFPGRPELVSSYVSRLIERGLVAKVEGQRATYRLINRLFKLFIRLKIDAESRKRIKLPGA